MADKQEGEIVAAILLQNISETGEKKTTTQPPPNEVSLPNIGYDPWLFGNTASSSSRESSLAVKSPKSDAVIGKKRKSPILAKEEMSEEEEQPSTSTAGFDEAAMQAEIYKKILARRSIYTATTKSNAGNPLPRMELQPKQEDVEDENVTYRRKQGYWHLPITPSQSVIKKFPNLPVANMKYVRLCGEFTVKNLIAIGDNSLIYNAMDPKENEYAIKISHVPENYKLLDSLKANGMSRYILKPFLTERLGDNYHLTVSNIINIDLDKLRKTVSFALMDDQIMEILSQVMNGLAEIHRLHFIHCDIHPANILMRGASVYFEGKHHFIQKIHCLITDFNSSVIVDNPKERQKVGIVQQAAYRAPEVLLGLPVGPEIDVWSLGILGLDMLCPGHWTLDDYDVNSKVKLGEHLYRIDRQVYSISWEMFEDCCARGDKEVYMAYKGFYKKRLKLKFPAYTSRINDLNALMKNMLKTHPLQRISSADAAEKYPVICDLA